MEGLSSYSEAFYKYLMDMNSVAAASVIKELKETMSYLQIVDEIIAPVFERIGDEWEIGALSLSQVYMSSRICENLFGEYFVDSGINYRKSPKMGIAVIDDYHLLGKRIVQMILKSNGYLVSDYGTQNPDSLVEFVINENVEILLISTLMLPSALRIKEVTKKLKEKREDIYIAVGGAPFRFDPDLWIEVGADAYGNSASDALKIVSEKVGVEK